MQFLSGVYSIRFVSHLCSFRCLSDFYFNATPCLEEPCRENAQRRKSVYIKPCPCALLRHYRSYHHLPCSAQLASACRTAGFRQRKSWFCPFQAPDANSMPSSVFASYGCGHLPRWHCFQKSMGTARQARPRRDLHPLHNLQEATAELLSRCTLASLSSVCVFTPSMVFRSRSLSTLNLVSGQQNNHTCLFGDTARRSFLCSSLDHLLSARS